jgi:HPt (histidine-containing phosphotransfer) domain-containing protein
MQELPVLDRTALDRLLRLGGQPLLQQMIELYLTHAPERLDALEQGLQAGDPGQVERAAHTLKSSAGNLGARRLQHSAEAVEALAARGVVDAELAARLREDHEASTGALRSALEELTS